MVGYDISLTGANLNDAVSRSFNQALSKAGVYRDGITFIVATGYGRVSASLADKTITEISCHATGAHHLFPDTGTVIDIGGQDSKVIRLDAGGKVIDFAMNDKCAAGTGRFLEVMAGAFQIPIEEFGAFSLRGLQEVPISSVCTVFAESEVISLIARSQPREAIIRGLHRSVVNRVWNMIQTVGVRGVVTMSGGVAKNRGIVSMLEELLEKPLCLYEEPQIIGALGAALLAKRHFRKNGLP